MEKTDTNSLGKSQQDIQEMEEVLQMIREREALRENGTYRHQLLLVLSSIATSLDKITKALESNSQSPKQ